MNKGYVTTVTLNSTFHFYKMHELISVSHERDSFNKHLRNYILYIVEVGSSAKDQALAVL